MTEYADLAVARRTVAGADNPTGLQLSNDGFAQAELVFGSADGCIASIRAGSCTVLCCADD